MAIDYQDNLIILKKYNLTGEDILSLTNLYLPLFGVDSYSLFFVLTTLIEKEEYIFKKLLDMLCLPNINILEHSFEKLEALGLIKMYYNKNKGYAVQIIRPLNVNEFTSSCLLSEYLAGQIGTVEFEKIKKSSILPNPRGFDNISKSFDEVFKTSNINISNIYDQITKAKTLNPIIIKEKDFDYLYFKMQFDDKFINEELLNDSKFKNNILEIAQVYSLNEEEMKDVIVTTINIDKELTFEYISNNARKLYRKKNNSEVVKLESIEKDTFYSSSMDDDKLKLFTYCENKSYADVLKELSNGISPSLSEIRMFEELKKNTNLPASVINMMILHVNKITKGQLPGYNYFEKLANVWIRAGVKNLSDVSDLLLESKAPNQSKSYNSKKEVKKPEWYDDYINELKEKEVKEKELSDEEVSKILDDAKSFFKEG